MKATIGGLFLVAAALACGATPQVTLERTPNGGIQPQVVVDEKGGVHLLYYAGDPKAGNLFYTSQRNGKWETPMRVNSREGDAIAVGTIRGGQLAVASSTSGSGAPAEAVHVAWNGANSVPGSSHEGVPMYYARLTPGATAFEPERDLMTFTGGLDGGGSVAADKEGNVYVAWHGRAPDARQGEIGRAVFVAKSTDKGATFSKEVQASPEGLGACGCCGMKAFADKTGALYLLFRKAEQMVNRDEVLLVSRDKGKSFAVLNSDPWKVGGCPMSSAALAQSRGTVLAAWETAGQVRFAKIADGKVSPITPPGTTERRKHPYAISNKRNETLFVWTDGTGWERGGALVWQVFDKDGKPVGEQTRKDGVPVWSFASAYAKPGGSFTILY
jgi:hypothetical protein